MPITLHEARCKAFETQVYSDNDEASTSLLAAMFADQEDLLEFVKDVMAHGSPNLKYNHRVYALAGYISEYMY